MKRTKECKKCGEKKPMSGFRRHRKTADGRFKICSDCAKKVQGDGRRARMALQVLNKNVPGKTVSAPDPVKSLPDFLIIDGTRYVKADTVIFRMDVWKNSYPLVGG